MGIKQYEGVGRRDLLYRLSVIIDLPFDVFMETPIWEIRNRAFLAGETQVLNHLQNLDQVFVAMTASRSQNPDEILNNYRDQLRDLVQIERPMSDEEIHRRKVEHNKKIAQDWANGR